MKAMLSRKAVHDRIAGNKSTLLKQNIDDVPSFSESKAVSQKICVDEAAAEKSNTSEQDQKISKLPPLRANNKKKRVTAQTNNFLLLGAKKAKLARSARTAARVGTTKGGNNKRSNTGSQLPLEHVVRLKYVKGFTQAVRTPCRMDELM
jgi:chromosome transmission fidelity protein 18